MKALFISCRGLFAVAAAVFAIHCPKFSAAAAPSDEATSLPPQRPVEVTLSVELLEVSQIFPEKALGMETSDESGIEPRQAA